MGSKTFFINVQIFGATVDAANLMKAKIDRYIKVYASVMNYDIDATVIVKSTSAVILDDSGIKYNESLRQTTGNPLPRQAVALIYTNQVYYPALHTIAHEVQKGLPRDFIVLDADQAVGDDQASLAVSNGYDVQLIGTQYQYRNPNCAPPIQNILAKRVAKLAPTVKLRNVPLHESWLNWSNERYTTYGLLIAHSLVDNSEINDAVKDLMAMPLGGEIIRITQ